MMTDNDKEEIEKEEIDKEEIDELLLRTRNSLIEYGQYQEPEEPDQTEILRLETI